MSNKPSFKQAQLDFAAHIRNPGSSPAHPAIEERRMAIYRDLFINSISGLLAGSFPVIKSLYDEQSWQNLVRQFFQTENNKTPYFPEIPREFVTWLKHHKVDNSKPFLYELAHYEWLELHLEKHTTEISKNSQLDPNELLMLKPQVSPLVKVQAYQYPVHQIKAQHQPKEQSAQHHLMLIWRDCDYHVHFAELQPFSALLLEQLTNNTELTGQQLLEQLAQAHQYTDVAQFVQFGLQTMTQWYNQDIILSANIN